MGKGLVPLLIEIQNDLDQDVSLSSLAERAGYSPFHFHRLFSKAAGWSGMVPNKSRRSFQTFKLSRFLR